MRRVRRSKTAIAGLETLLAQGLPKFGLNIIVQKQRLVDRAIETYLARHPRNGSKLRDKPYYRFDVSDSPFAVIYSFDDDILDVHFIVHKSSDTRSLTPSDVEW